MSDPRQRLDTPRTSRRPSLNFNQEAVGRYSESIARFLGTGRYLMWQTILVIVWITLNLFAVGLRWDPYPFILLNLLFSTQAAYTAPIIMMSQNRQNERDRVRAAADYATDLAAKAEIEKLTRQMEKLEKEKIDLILARVPETK